MTQYRWLCQPVQPSVPTAPAAPSHPSYIIYSTLPPVSGDEFATLQREVADLRQELDKLRHEHAAVLTRNERGIGKSAG